ncbi:MAG: Uma2 family endonuclease [Cyanobacteria bacterium J06638_22]
MPLKLFLQEPLDRTEWVSVDHLVEKQAMTAKTGRIQARLARYWGNYQESSGQGGEVYTETHCQTVGRVRCPDVAYLPPDLVEQYGDFKVLPQSFPLIAEIVSPTDEMEAVFLKVQEYLVSGCQEVWLILPESQWVLLVTADQQQLRGLQDEAQTMKTLPGFKVAVQTLLA